MQILIKLVLTIFLFYIGCLIWKTDIDVGRFRPDRLMKKKAEEIISQLPSREKDALYQNDKIEQGRQLTKEDYDLISAILCGLSSKKERINYFFIFGLSAIAILLAVYMDFLKP